MPPDSSKQAASCTGNSVSCSVSHDCRPCRSTDLRSCPAASLLQCGRFHPLDSFDGEMRSCRRQLARHAERRRAARAAAAAVRRAATASPSSSQVAGSGGAAAATMQAAAGPASPEPSNAVAATAGTAAVAAAAPQQQAEAATSGQPQAQAVSQAQAQASGSDSGSSSLSSPPTERCPSPTAGLDALLAAAEEEEAAERQAAAKRRAATKRPLEEAAMQEEQRAPKRLVCMGTAEGWCAPPLAATWPAAPAKPANPTLDAAALSCQTQQASLPASLLPPVAPLALPPLPALPVPLLPPPVAAAVASLGTSLQLLQQLPLQPQLAGLPTPPGWHEAYMAGLASMAAERIMLELLIAARQ